MTTTTSDKKAETQKMVKLQIDNIPVEVPEGTMILEAARSIGKKIPTLCEWEGLSRPGACRICVVELEGRPNLVPSCAYPVEEGMRVLTNTARLRRARKTIIELLLANHDNDCLTCVRCNRCELQSLAVEYGIREYRYQGARRKEYPVDHSTTSVERNPNLCIDCGRCVRTCDEIQSVNVIEFVNRGFESIVMPAFNKELNQVECVMCGQCINACPTGALREKSSLKGIFKAINDPTKVVIAQTAPSIRVAIGEEFGFEPGAYVAGKMVAAFRRMGIQTVFDTDLSADLTIVEEGTELIQRLTKAKGEETQPLPLFTSCCPAWVKFVEHQYPELIPHLSTAKSPHSMMGALVKTYYAQKMGIDPKSIVTVSVMPCTAKKYEIERPEMSDSGYQDNDFVLTTRELARMIRLCGIDFANLPDEEFDNPLGESSGAGLIFGATGGVMEAALRSAYYYVTGNEFQEIDFHDARGFKGIKEADITIGETTIKVAVTHGLANARQLLERVREDKCRYSFIEVMACPGGCIGGGGQPLPCTSDRRTARAKTIYEMDKRFPIRQSHRNPSITRLYEEFLGQPGEGKAHHLLHTSYTERGRL